MIIRQIKFLYSILLLPFLPFLLGMSYAGSLTFYKENNCTAQVSCQPNLSCDVTPPWEVFINWKKEWDDTEMVHRSVDGIITIHPIDYKENTGWLEIDEFVEVENDDGTFKQVKETYLTTLDKGINLGTKITGVKASYVVELSQEGNLFLWMEGNNPSGSSDSVNYGVDGVRLGTLTFYKEKWFVGDWANDRQYVTDGRAVVFIPEGKHTLDIFSREDGTKFREIRITNDSDYIPNGIGE